MKRIRLIIKGRENQEIQGCQLSKITFEFADTTLQYVSFGILQNINAFPYFTYGNISILYDAIFTIIWEINGIVPETTIILQPHLALVPGTFGVLYPIRLLSG